MRQIMRYFLGNNTPIWYKATILSFIILNVLLYLVSPTLAGWVIIGEFIFTLMMALKCYPLLPGGIIAIQVLAMNLATRETFYHEVEANIEVILLLVFMVSAIYFMKDFLMYIFGNAFIGIKSKTLLSLLFVFLGAFLSAFLDALTVTAVIISVAIGMYHIYHKVHSSINEDLNKNNVPDQKEMGGEALAKFRAFLRNLVMHGVVGTALGGVCTSVGEPQNLLIASKMGWTFVEFFQKMSPITIPVFFAGIVTTIIIEKAKIFGYGVKLPSQVRTILENKTIEAREKMSTKHKYFIKIQAVCAVVLIVALGTHIVEVGYIGLALIIIQTSLMGINNEHAIGKAFEESLPFTALLIVFFVIVAMIHDLHLFKPIISHIFSLPESEQTLTFYLFNGLLSSISDNVFVATININEVKAYFDAGKISREHYEKLAIAINTGTNLPSVATPNGQAAFLFLLTSSLAPLINLSYFRMIKMALPYTIVLTAVGYICLKYCI